MQIARDAYLSKLNAKRGNSRVKIVTGIRRCGKTYLLMNLFPQMLKEEGVPGQRIITVDLEDYANRRLRDADELYAAVDRKSVV